MWQRCLSYKTEYNPGIFHGLEKKKMPIFSDVGYTSETVSLAKDTTFSTLEKGKRKGIIYNSRNRIILRGKKS